MLTPKTAASMACHFDNQSRTNASTPLAPETAGGMAGAVGANGAVGIAGIIGATGEIGGGCIVGGSAGGGGGTVATDPGFVASSADDGCK